jgi:hypothetical protein
MTLLRVEGGEEEEGVAVLRAGHVAGPQRGRAVQLDPRLTPGSPRLTLA